MEGYDKFTPLEDAGEDIFEENRNNSVNEKLLLFNHFARYTAELISARIIFGAGLSYLPLHKSVRPQLEFGIFKAASEKLSLSYRTGWSPGYINEFQYVEQKINEAGLNLDAETDYAHPPISVSSIFKTEWKFDDNFTFNISPYFVWYYDLHGMEMQTSYLDTITDADSAVFLDSDKGYSAGSDFCWKITGDSGFLKLIYSLGFTRYHTGGTGWVYSNNDVRHTCKLSFVSSPSERFKYGMNFFIYIDRPFTPETVMENEDGSTEIIKEEYNSARDFVPRFQLDFKVSWLFKKRKYDWSLFFNSTNLLFFLNPVMDGFRDGKEDNIGVSTSDFENRSYKFVENWTDLLQCQLGFSIKF
jgi:hypothetical protein